MALPTRVSREQQQHQQHGGPMVHPLDLMHREFDDLLSRFFGGAGSLFGPAAAALPAEAGMLASLAAGYAVDVREDDRHIYVEADLPGFKKEDIDIAIDDHTLTISAEHRDEFSQPPQQQQSAQPQQTQQAQQTQQPQQQQQKQPQQRPAQQPQQKGQYLLRERRYQTFARSFTLPQNVDEQNVQAKLDNGVLHITLNKLQAAQPKKIQVS